MSVSSYSEVDAVEQKDMVNSGVGGAKDRNLRTEVGCRSIAISIIPIIYPIIFKYLVPVIYSIGTPGDFAALGSLLVLPRAAADTRGQYSILPYTGASIVRCAMQGQQRGAQERRKEGGTRERGTGRKRSLGLLVVRQQELG
jgi:hypothetical protein